MNEFQQKNITYAGAEDKGLTIKLTDKEGGRWVIWKNTQKGQATEAYLSFQNFKFGDSFGISYKEQEKTFTGKEGKPITYTERTIFSIMPTIATQPIQTPTQPKNVQPEAKYEATEAKDAKFWDKKAYKQCLWNYWLEHGQMGTQGFQSKPLEQLEMDLVWQVFNQIEQDADKRFMTPEEIVEQTPF